MSKLRPSVTGALTRRALKDHGPPVEVMPQGDRRMDVLASALVPLTRKEEFVREITTLWTRAQSTFLTIGQYLIMAKQKLPHGDYTIMVERELPFSPNTAFQIRTAAEAVSSGRLPAETLPPNYSTIYQLSTLPDHLLEEAKRSGLVRPDLRRAEIVAFKKKVREATERPVSPPGATAQRLAELRRQKAAIEEEIARLERVATQDVEGGEGAKR
ncbi:hypothetical protein JMJ56_26965 [Belnapia sp. T18]|uniref:DUF4391 domain-containing protein n=1 Tax=Belnapia arida TaxID=2804533 RepID=A0ABS1UAC3_9PROT|nr:hypothetical protein [Belnapia arida]MBL6081638.1 hypothetical protein [Belnapia arida]